MQNSMRFIVYNFLFYTLLVSASSTPFLAFKKINILGLSNYSYSPRGPGSVARSLIEGLKVLNVPYEIGISSNTDNVDVVLVQENHRMLDLARRLKKAGLVKCLVVGPNFYPDEVNFPEVDIHIVPSESIITYCQDVAPELVSRCRVWPAGVDVSYWSPISDEYRYSKNVLVYWKTEGEDFCNLVESKVRKYGWNPIRLRYGGYTQPQYKQLLSQCRFAVFISRSESQGIALAECWSMDIPTLAWNPHEAYVRAHVYNYLVSCPYLNENLGADWKTIDELEGLLFASHTILEATSPREWVLQYMSDEASVRRLIDTINEFFNEN